MHSNLIDHFHEQKKCNFSSVLYIGSPITIKVKYAEDKQTKINIY